MLAPRQGDGNSIPRPHRAARLHSPHHAAKITAVLSIFNEMLHQAGLKAVNLVTGTAQAGDADQRVAEVENRAFRQVKQIDAARGDVLAKFAGTDNKALLCQKLMTAWPKPSSCAAFMLSFQEVERRRQPRSS